MAQVDYATAFVVVTAGTTTIIFPERGSDVIHVWKGLISCSGDATLSWEDTAGATLYHRITTTGFVLDEDETPWMSAPNGLGIRLVLDTAGVRVSGRLFYSR